MAACPCVLVLCGAPAAGKSSLSRELRRHPARRVGAVHHISFDSIERESTDTDGFDPQVWAAARRTGLEQLRQRLRDARQHALNAGALWCQHDSCVLTETEPWSSVASLAAHEQEAHGLRPEDLPEPDAERRQQLVIVDDNMHLRSMRHACYRVAAEEQAAFLTVHVTAPLETLLARNAGRTGAECVPEASLRKIVAELEPPAVCTSAKAPAKPLVYWERDVVKLAHEAGTAVRLSTASAAEPHALPAEPASLAEAVWPWILRAWGTRPSPAEVEQQRADAEKAKAATRKDSRAETAASLGVPTPYNVAVDAVLRNLVSATMAQAKSDTHGPAVKVVAAAANKQRKLVLQRAKERTKEAGGNAEDAGSERESLLAWCEAEYTRGLQEQLI